MRRSNPRTETISCDGGPTTAPSTLQETAFEKQRGISHVEMRRGFCQVHVNDLGEPLMAERLHVLKALATAEVSIDFLKLTPSGLSFVVPQALSGASEKTLESLGVQHSVRGDRSIVTVHAVSMRDEEGLIAEIVQTAIASGAQIDHIGDGHDRLLLVVSNEHAQRIAAYFEKSLMIGGKRQGKQAKSA